MLVYPCPHAHPVPSLIKRRSSIVARSLGDTLVGSLGDRQRSAVGEKQHANMFVSSQCSFTHVPMPPPVPSSIKRRSSLVAHSLGDTLVASLGDRQRSAVGERQQTIMFVSSHARVPMSPCPLPLLLRSNGDRRLSLVVLRIPLLAL